MQIFSAEIVELIHDDILNPGELSGRALDKSLEGALGRVDNRLLYGMIEDVFDLAASYAVAIATGHCFNDGNKRTAFRVMEACLGMNGVGMELDVQDIGPRIIAVAQGQIDEADFATWLRKKAG